MVARPRHLRPHGVHGCQGLRGPPLPGALSCGCAQVSTGAASSEGLTGARGPTSKALLSRGQQVLLLLEVAGAISDGLLAGWGWGRLAGWEKGTAVSTLGTLAPGLWLGDGAWARFQSPVELPVGRCAAWTPMPGPERLWFHQLLFSSLLNSWLPTRVTPVCL